MVNAHSLDPEAISQGKALGLLARRIVEGYRVGEHRSPFRGFALEFAQHREYTAGDDIRHLDWKVLGRSDRYYIKQYEQDTNFVAHLIVDASRSMTYGSGKLAKFHYAKALAACLGYLILLQRDAVALALGGSEVSEYLPKTDNFQRINHIMDRLAAFEPDPGTDLKNVLDQVAVRARSKGITILISDLFDDETAILKGLQRLRFTGGEVIVFQVLDPYELSFPFEGTWKLQGLEGEAMVQTSPRDIRKSYLENFEKFRTSLRRHCEALGAHYILADTSKGLAETISGYLAFRRMVGRK